MSFHIIKQKDFDLLPKNTVKFIGKQGKILERTGGEKAYRTEVKSVYSETGIYFLFSCEDRRITCTFQKDGEDLYMEDVLEIFLQPDVAHPVYMEYELSPMNKELALMVCHNGNSFHGWLPFHYTGMRCARHITWTKSGELQSGAPCREWYAMIYIPFALFEGTIVRYPAEGTVWRGNIFRIDRDDDEASRYALFPECGIEFHDFEKFGEMLFL